MRQTHTGNASKKATWKLLFISTVLLREILTYISIQHNNNLFLPAQPQLIHKELRAHTDKGECHQPGEA